jgi:hypothetical protein
VRTFPAWPVNYRVSDEYHRQDEGPPPPLTIGSGLIYRRFRVEDVWFSYDKHGQFAVGMHVFLTEVTGTDDDRPHKLAPGYFTSTEQA